MNVPGWAPTDTWAFLPSMPQAMDPRFGWERAAEHNEVRSQGSTSSSLSSFIHNAHARSTISPGTCGIKVRKDLYLSWMGVWGSLVFFGATTGTLYLPHSRFHSPGADHPSTSCCVLQRPLWASPQPCSACPFCQTEERGKQHNFFPIPIFARPSPLHIFQLNIYDNHQ